MALEKEIEDILSGRCKTLDEAKKESLETGDSVFVGMTVDNQSFQTEVIPLVDVSLEILRRSAKTNPDSTIAKIIKHMDAFPNDQKLAVKKKDLQELLPAEESESSDGSTT